MDANNTFKLPDWLDKGKEWASALPMLRKIAGRVLAFVRSAECIPIRQALPVTAASCFPLPFPPNAPNDGKDTVELRRNRTMYGGEGSYAGAYYGTDDGGNEGSWYPATESVASGSASLSIPPSGFPPTSEFPTAGPSTSWFPTHAAPSSIPYYSSPPAPSFWGTDQFLATVFAPPAGYASNHAQQAFHGYGAGVSQQYSHPNPYVPPPPVLDELLMNELRSASIPGLSSSELSFSSSSRASTPFNTGSPSTDSWGSWPSTSTSGSSRWSSVEPGDMSEAFGLSLIDPEDARRFVENTGELHFAEDAPGREFTPAPSVNAALPITLGKRKRTSRKQTPADSATNVGRLEDLDWQPSDMVRLDEGVSSEYVDFPHGLKLTSQKPIFRLERVTGVPSKLPHFEIATAFILSIPKGVFPKNMTLDNVFCNLCPHSYESSTGSRSGVDTRLSSFWFGRDPVEMIDTRRATPKCRDTTSVVGPRVNGEACAGDAVTAFTRAIQRVYCRGLRSDGARCPGTVSAVRRLHERTNGKTHGLQCTQARMLLAPGSSHSSNAILVDEGLFLKASAGERIIEDTNDDQLCAGVVSVRNMSGTVTDCEFNHSKDGRPFTARLEMIRCGARITFFCPYETTYSDEEKYGDLVRTMIAYPHPEHGHIHPTALGTKCPCTARDKYKEAARRFGPGATVAKIENAASSKLIFGTATPGEYHSGLLNTALKNRLLREVRSELSFAGDSAADALASYVVQQQAISDPDKHYMHSIIWRDGKRIIFGVCASLLRRIHQLRALDVDTTFQPVKGKLQIFAISGWLSSQNRALTVMRIWMEVHDEPSFKLMWTEIFRLVLLLTGLPLWFKRAHRGGKILGLLSDMEAAPLLGFASALWEEMTPEYRAKIGNLESVLLFVLRICGVHFNRGIAELKHLSTETRSRMQQLRFLRSPAELAEFEAWLHDIDDPTGAVESWWKHKKMHHWLLPALIPYLSKIGSDFDLLEPNTNLGEGQHRWNNIQTGVDMATVESLIKYEQLDISVESQLQTAERTGDLRNTRNNVVHRYISRSTRRIAAHEKYKRTSVVDAKVRLREVIVSETQSHLKKAKAAVESNPSLSNQTKVKGLHERLREARLGLKKAKAEAKSNSSGRVHSRHRIGSRKLAFLQSSKLVIPAASPPAESPEGELISRASDETVAPAVIPTRTTRATTRGCTTSSAATAKAPPRPVRKKRKVLDLEWEVRVGGTILTARQYADQYRDEFAANYPEYLHLL
ncbi:hypothetical protein C8F04DRAFT_1231885 [Mycena alexandri]|uniref:Uncharacterized protein n=1 Tax=Mycena alexandri TaxID=1745969 RepID=A0AAD6T7I3_9AGAR|nr:hypothetical protein C8F04DRAFT_1231885 [Mycena alexandri]